MRPTLRLKQPDEPDPARPGPRPPAAPTERARVENINVLPALATLANLSCGLLALLFGLLATRAGPTRAAAADNLTFACWLIVAALVFDGLDGRLARLLRRVSRFGAHLDALADLVTFAVAPGLLAMCLFVRGAPLETSTLAARGPVTTAAAATLVFVACAALRLARFQAEQLRDDPRTQFSGLPAPAAGLALTTLVLLHERAPDLLSRARPEPSLAPESWLAGIAVLVIPPACVALGLMMASRLPYPHPFYSFVKKRRPLVQVAVLLAAVGAVFIWPEWSLLGLAWIYVLAGPLLGRARGVAGA